jgi:hypothetical protein
MFYIALLQPKVDSGGGQKSWLSMWSIKKRVKETKEKS